MEQIVTKLNLDLYNPTSYEVIKAQQGDTERVVEITLKNDGSEYIIPSGVNVSFEGTRADSSSFLIEDIKVNKGTLTFNIFQAIDVAGISEGKLVLREGDSILSSIPIMISVQKYGYDKEHEYEAHRTVIDELIRDVTKVTEFEILSKATPTEQKNGQFWLEEY